LKKLTKRNPKHLSILTNLYFKYKISFNEIVPIYLDLVKYKIPITSHISTLDEVKKKINNKKSDIQVDDILQYIPSYYNHRDVNTRVRNLIKNNLEHSDIIKSFLENGKYRIYELYTKIIKLLEESELEWRKENINYKENEFIFSNEDESILILKISTLHRHKTLGSLNWYDVDEWKWRGLFKQSKKHTEYFIYDFNKKKNDDKSFISIIIGPYGQIAECRLYSGENFDISEDITYRKYLKQIPDFKYFTMDDYWKKDKIY